MKVRILFTYGHNPLSSAIRHITDEPVSHVAIQTDQDRIIHSNFLGLHIEDSEDFFFFSRLFDFIEVEVDDIKFYSRLAALHAEYRGYDFKALLFLGIRYLLPKSWTPKVNLWEVTNQYICTELVSFMLDGEPDSMITPYQMYLKLKQKEANQ
jgi:hypothetical protein